ncbi:ComEC family competence protein [Patescibacteria group bacterium]|nr:ComEC family competence protein [Patescibacteria group bacterium]
MSKSQGFLGVSFIFLALNFVWLLYFDNRENNPGFIFDNFYSFKAKVINTDKKIDGWNILVEPLDLDNFSGNILVYIPLYPEYYYGDVLELSGKVYKPEPIEDDEGKTFFYDKYLAKDNIYATCFRPKVKYISQDKGISFYIFQAKNYFWKNLDIYLREPASSLAKAMLLASRREIPGDTRNIFAQVGLSHVVAISGLHMAIIVWLVRSFLFAIGLSRKKAFWFLILILFLYLYLIGFPASAVRASLMLSILMLGPFLGRDTESIYSLVLAADIFVLLNPYLLLYDIGFQLSFLAVLGLLYYVKFFQKVLFFVPQKFKLREVMSVTLAAQIFTWPLIVYYFGIVSIVAPLANFLILPFLPLVLVFSLFLAGFGFWPFLAKLLAWPLFIILKIIVVLSFYLSQLPRAYIEVQDFSSFYMIFFLCFMFILTFIIKPQNYE